MNDRRRILILAALVMVGLAVTITAALYQSALKQKRLDLHVQVQHEAHLMRAVARFDMAHSDPGMAREDTLSQIADAMRENDSNDTTREITIGYRDGDDIVFLFQENRQGGLLRIPWNSEWAEPMRQALSGECGTITGADYEGETVVAAYEPISELNLGFVAKTDLAEIRAPFVAAVWNSVAITAVAVTVGLFVLRLRINPLIERSEISEERALDALASLENQKHAMDEHALVSVTDPSGSILYANDKFCEISQYTKEELLGQSHRIVNSGYHPGTFWGEAWRSLKQGNVWSGEVCNRTKDGTLYWVDATIVPFKDRSGTISRFVGIQSDVTERNRARESLQEMNIALTNAMPGIARLDCQGIYVEVNENYANMLGYPPEELIGGGWEHTVLAEDQVGASEAYQQMLREGRSEFEACAIRKDGSSFYKSVYMVSITNAQGEFTGHHCFMRDISESKAAAEELRDSNEKMFLALEREWQASDLLKETMEQLKKAWRDAETANQAKSEFLANMSHEIRTPMTAILGFAENLIDLENADMQVRSPARTIKRNGEYLLSLINDILDISKIEAGRMTIERTTCHPCAIVAEVASLMRVRAEAKGLPFNIEYAGPIPDRIETDPTRLRQILINLVGNAIKFTEVGSVRLVTRFIDDRDTPHLQFDVIDSGCGMTNEHIANLFQPFSQADSSITREFGGTGLGLTISKRFAELLGGDVVVYKTELGRGTTFRATIAHGLAPDATMLDSPMEATVVSPVAKEAMKSTPATLDGCRILLAEDGPDNQRLIAYILEKAGAELTLAENGQGALDAIEAAPTDANPFDCILMDMQMPVMDGYRATRELRRRAYKGPIIALTAHAMESDRDKCIAAGCDDYESKPIDRVKLIETVARHVRQDTYAVQMLKSHSDDGMNRRSSTPSEEGAKSLHKETRTIDAADQTGLLQVARGGLEPPTCGL